MGLLDDGLLDPKHFGILREESRPPKAYKVVGFDSEDDTKGQPLAFTFHDGESAYYTKDPRKALKYVLEYPKPAVFCAHNLEYDIGNLFKSTHFKWVDRMVYASRLLRVSLKFSKNYFLNSAAFFPGSLKSMGEVIGLKKLEGDPFSREYAERDAHIVQLFMQRVQDRLLHDYGAGLGVSIGQASMEIYRRRFMPEKKQETWVHPAALSAYYGGRVEMFYKGVLNEPVNVADFNSCYPYVMRHREYPDTSTLGRSSLDHDKYGIGKFTVQVPDSLFVPPLPFRQQDSHRLYFPCGIMTGWWTFAEVRRAEELGCRILKEWKSIGTSVGVRPFDHFVDHFYSLREKAKDILKKVPDDENATFDSAYYKLVMNNLYGKLSQHKPSQVLSRTPLPESVLRRYPEVKMHRIEPFYSYTLARAKAPPTANYLWGIYVTAYSRLHLLDHLLKVQNTPGAKLVYCDTDSVMYTGDVAMPFGKKLGEMSRERYDIGVFRSSKGYLLCNRIPGWAPPVTHKYGVMGPWHYQLEKVACKGVPTAYALDFVVNGTAKVLKPQRLKEALIQLKARGIEEGVKLKATETRKHVNKDGLEREIGINVWDKVRKEMRSVYIKRRGSTGVTYPINVDSIKEAEVQAYVGMDSEHLELPENMHLIPKVKPSTAFLDLVVPDNWFDEEANDPGVFRYIESVELHHLRAMECESLSPGETWVAGEILGTVETQFGVYYKLNIRNYLDLELDSGAMVGLLHPRYLQQEGCDEEYVGSSVDISLKEEYIKDRPLSLRVELTEKGAGTFKVQ